MPKLRKALALQTAYTFLPKRPRPNQLGHAQCEMSTMRRRVSRIAACALALCLAALPKAASFALGSTGFAPSLVTGRAQAGICRPIVVGGARRVADRWSMQMPFAPIRGKPVQKTVVVPVRMNCWPECFFCLQQVSAGIRNPSVRTKVVLKGRFSIQMCLCPRLLSCLP